MSMDTFVRGQINQMEQFSEIALLDGDLVVEGRLIDASNATLFGYVENDSGEKRHVVYKPIAGERPLWDFPDGNLASREVAAFLLSKESGLNCVPLTVMRDGPFGSGAVQLWIDVDEEIDFIEYAQQNDPAIRRIALFDVLINNTDRKFGHILIDQSGDVFGCDHGISFHQEFKLRTVLWQFAGEPLTPQEIELVERTKTWLTSESAEGFRALLSPDEVHACLRRIETVIKDGFPYPSEEWPAVPWPPV